MDEQVRVTLRFFAIMRERIGESERQVEFAAGSRIDDVMRYVEGEFAQIAPLFRSSMVMRNHEYVDREEHLADGDEIAFIPPVSGGERDHYRVTTMSSTVRRSAPGSRTMGRARLSRSLARFATTRAGVASSGLTTKRMPKQPKSNCGASAARCASAGRCWPSRSSTERGGSRRRGERRHRRLLCPSRRGLPGSRLRDRAHQADRSDLEEEAYDDGETWIGSEADYQVEIGRVPTRE